MKALPIETRADLSPIHLYAKVADWLLFDGRAPREATRPGGLGKTFDWTLAGKSRSRNSVHAVGRARCGQRRRGAAHHARAGGRCVVGRRARARREGPGQNPRLRSRRARHRRQSGGAEGEVSCASTAHDRVPHDSVQPNSFRTGPDERGHFGIYGGRFVAETLMPLILELEKAYDGGQGRSGVQARDGRPSEELRRPAVAAVSRRAADRAFWRRENLFQARGPQPHRRAQGEQRARPDHAGQAHGQAARHRRDRRRHARRRHRDDVREVRPRMRGVHGRARRRAPAAERAAHAGAGRAGAAGRGGREDAQGRDERGAARLGHQRRRTRSTASARSPARIPIRRWCATSNASSATRPARRCRRPKAGCRIR